MFADELRNRQNNQNYKTAEEIEDLKKRYEFAVSKYVEYIIDIIQEGLQEYCNRYKSNRCYMYWEVDNAMYFCRDDYDVSRDDKGDIHISDWRFVSRDSSGNNIDVEYPQKYQHYSKRWSHDYCDDDIRLMLINNLDTGLMKSRGFSGPTGGVLGIDTADGIIQRTMYDDIFKRVVKRLNQEGFINVRFEYKQIYRHTHSYSFWKGIPKFEYSKETVPDCHYVRIYAEW